MISAIKKGSVLVNILLGIAFVVFTFGQIGRFSPWEIPAYLNVYELFLFVATILLAFRQKKSIVIKNNLLIPSLITFFAWLGISLVISFFSYNAVQNILAVLYFVRLCLYVLFFVTFLQYIESNKGVVTFYKILTIFICGLVIVLSLIQYYLYPNIGNIAYAGWDPHLYRLVGLYLDPPLTASVFALLALFVLLEYKNVLVRIAVTGILGVLFFLTYSRGGFLAVLVTVAVYSLRKMKFQYLMGFFIAAGILLVIIPKNISEGLNLTRTTSIKTRLADYHKAYRIWQKSPLIGIGYNHIRAEKDSYEEEIITEKFNPSHASASFHSSFLMILVTGGAIGFLLYLLVLWKIALLGSYALYSTIFLSIFSLTDNVLLHPFILFLWFFLIGVTHLSRSEL